MDSMERAYILMTCDLGSEQNIIKSISQLEGVKEIHGVLGLYDIIVKIESESEDLVKKIVSQIRKTPKIKSTMTLTKAEGENYFAGKSEKLIGSMLGQNSSKAYVIVHCDKGEEWNVLKNLSNMPEVKEADAVFGLYDVVCKVETSSYKELEKAITKSIRFLPHVRTSMTLNVIPEQD